MSPALTASQTVEPTLESLAQQLREGPLQGLIALQVRAEVLAEKSPADDQELLDQLESIVGLAQSTMQVFQEFTANLARLADQMAARSRSDSARH
jgi:hypothetical protein